MSDSTNACPKCGAEMGRREQMFYWRGEWKPGLVCVKCNALWPVPGDEIPPLRSVSNIPNARIIK